MLLLLFGIMGTGILLPWNTFISGADYFEELYPCSHIEFKFAIAYMASLMIFMLLAVVLGHLFSLGARVVGGYVLLLLSMLGSLPVKTQSAHILMVILTGIGDALVQGSMYGVAGSFPPLFMRALMMGTAVAGVIVSAIRVFSKVRPVCTVTMTATPSPFVFSSYPKRAKAAHSSYSSACLPSSSSSASLLGSYSGQYARFYLHVLAHRSILATFDVHGFFCRRHPYGQIYLANCGTEEEKRRSRNEMQNAAKLPAPEVLAAEVAAHEPDDGSAAVEDDESDLLHSRGRVGGSVSSGSLDTDNSNLTLRQRMRLIVELLRRPLLSSAVAVAGNFGITLALFPGVLTEMRSSNRNLDDWFVLLPSAPQRRSVPSDPPIGSSPCSSLASTFSTVSGASCFLFLRSSPTAIPIAGLSSSCSLA